MFDGGCLRGGCLWAWIVLEGRVLEGRVLDTSSLGVCDRVIYMYHIAQMNCIVCQ